MKIIKQLKPYHPEEDFIIFIKEIPLISLILLISLPALSILRFILISQSGQNQNQNNLSQTYTSYFSIFLLNKFSQIFWYLIIGVSLLKKQQIKGSLCILFSFMLKSSVIYLIQKSINSFLNEWPLFDFFVLTSIPLQFCLCLIIENALQKSDQLTYFLIKPFQIKTKFLPLFIVCLLQTMGLKIDILIPIILGVIFRILKLNKKIKAVCLLIQRKANFSFVQKYGFIKSGGKIKSLKQIDIISTDNSIVLEEK